MGDALVLHNPEAETLINLLSRVDKCVVSVRKGYPSKLSKPTIREIYVVPRNVKTADKIVSLIKTVNRTARVYVITKAMIPRDYIVILPPGENINNAITLEVEACEQ